MSRCGCYLLHAAAAGCCDCACWAVGGMAWRYGASAVADETQRVENIRFVLQWEKMRLEMRRVSRLVVQAHAHNTKTRKLFLRGSLANQNMYPWQHRMRDIYIRRRWSASRMPQCTAAYPAASIRPLPAAASVPSRPISRAEVAEMRYRERRARARTAPNGRGW